MKILAVTDMGNNRTSDGLRMRLLADSAILPSGKPFFVPDFADHFTCQPALCVRVDRLGKHIARRYAHRYYNSVAACGLVMAHNLADADLLDATDARNTSFDGALLLGKLVPYDGATDITVNLTTEMGNCVTCSWPELPDYVDGVITELSRYMTLKMGDLIVLPARENEAVELHVGGELRATVGDAISLKTRIR